MLYESLLPFTQPLRVLWIYASLRATEPMRKEKAFYLRMFTRDINIRKSMISCCACYTHLAECHKERNFKPSIEN